MENVRTLRFCRYQYCDLRCVLLRTRERCSVPKTIIHLFYFTTAVALNQLMRHDNLCCNKIRILNMIDYL